jgi:hypothetical protein
MSLSGNLSSVNLADVVQMCCLACMDGDLQLVHATFVGHIFVRKGQIVHAQAGSEQGEEAFYSLLSLKEGSFSFKRNVGSSEESIEADWEYLLIEGARREHTPSSFEKTRPESSGNTLLEMLQMYCLAGLDGDLRLFHDGLTGHIFLREGQIIHARAGKKKGEEALYLLLALEHVSFEFHSDVDSPEDSIYSHWEHLLMESSRRREEQELVGIISGDLSTAKLADVLHMCCLASMNGELQLAHDGFTGHIFLRKGQIVHAQASPKKGEEAFHHLLSFKKGSFEFRKDVSSSEESINARWEYLLIEAARRRDERVLAVGLGGNASTDSSEKHSELLQRLVGLNTCRGTAILGKAGKLLASDFEFLQAPLLALAREYAALSISLASALSLQKDTREKYCIFLFPENALIALPQFEHLFLFLVARVNLSEQTVPKLFKAVRQASALLH